MARSSGTVTEGDSDRPVSEPEASVARKAGRGGIAVLGAKVFFIFSGLAQQTVLPRVIGLAGYGALARVLALANILNNVVVASSTQGVSRAVARAIGAEGSAFRRTLRVHVPLAFVLAAAFAAVSPWIARWEGAPHIVRPLLLMALVALFYGLYAPIIGLLNGRGQFTRQAALDVVFAVLRTAGIIGVGWFFARDGGSGVLGSTLGFALAAACILPTAAWFARSPSRSMPDAPRDAALRPSAPEERPRDYLAQLGPLAAAQFFTNAVMQVDITLLGHFLARGGDVKTSDEWVAVYRACQLFAFLPYQLLLSITQILFPMLARAKAAGDTDGVRRYVERGARLAGLACGMLVSVIVALPTQLLAFAYTREVAERGAATLRVLALGQGAYTMLAIATTVLASLGRERLSAMITLGALGAVVVACGLLAAGAPFGAPQLEGTALGTTIALVGTLVVAAVAVHKVSGGFMPKSSMARVLVGLAVASAVGSLLPASHGRGLTVVLATIVAATYVLVLIVTRELTRADAAALREVRGK
jgi:stage V sporulation protein B